MTRALVLGGGGLTGMAWEAGALRGLADAGIDVAAWDRVVGTSAGAFVGAHLLNGSLAALLAAHEEQSLDDEIRLLAGRTGSWMTVTGRRRGLRWLPRAWIGGRAIRAATSERLSRRRRGTVGPPPLRPWPAAGGPDAGLTRLGSIALASRTPSERDLRRVVESLLRPVVEWPESLIVTAVDAHDGSLICLDATSGVALVDAVAATSALPILFPPVTIAGRRYIDGGMRSDTNIWLAGEVDEIVTLVPVDHGGLAREAAAIRERGTLVRVLTPGSAARRHVGSGLDMLDPIRRSGAAKAGYEDGLAAGRAWLTT